MNSSKLIPEDAIEEKNVSNLDQEKNNSKSTTDLNESLTESECEKLINDKDDLIFEMSDFGMTIEVTNWCRKKKEIEILKHVNAMVMGGEILAIMGPSGAGKTSMLECATLNQPPNAKITGTVKINNCTLTKKMFQDHSYIVQQRDWLPATLTCKETLMFAAKNCIINKERISARVDELLECLGLEECANVRVGNFIIPGLSGGQKRRLSVGLALVKMPKFLFLDEPTSGLDSATALKTCLLLQKLVIRYKMATVLTIHQPNTKIYDTFTKLLLLYRGQVVYFGPAKEAENWFSKLGCPLPAKTNIADHLMDVLEDEEFHKQSKSFSMKRLCRRLNRKDRLSLVKPEGEVLVKLKSRLWPSLCTRIGSTLHKECLIIVRDPMVYTGRCAVFVMVGVFFSLVYIKCRDRVQEHVLSRLWLLMWLSACPTSMACAQVFIHSMDIVTLKRNVRNGIQHPLPFIFSRLLQLPMMFIFSICGLTIGGYWMCNMDPAKYWLIVTINALILTCMEFIAEFFAVTTSHFLVGVQAFMGLWFAQFLFNGMLVREEHVIWPLKILCYILPLRYGLMSIGYEEFIDSTFEGTERCNPMTDIGCKPAGYMCKTEICFGETGTEILDTLHLNFELLSSEDKTMECITYLLIFAATLKVLYVFRIMWMF